MRKKRGKIISYIVWRGERAVKNKKRNKPQLVKFLKHFFLLISRKSFHPISKHSNALPPASRVQSSNKSKLSGSQGNEMKLRHEQSSDCICCKYFENTQLHSRSSEKRYLELSLSLRCWLYLQKAKRGFTPLQLGKFVEHFNNRRSKAEKKEANNCGGDEGLFGKEV